MIKTGLKIALAWFAIFATGFSQEKSDIKTYKIKPIVQTWIFGQFPELVTDQEVQKDIADLLSAEYDGAIPITTKKSEIDTYELRVLIENNEVDSCNGSRLIWNLVLSWHRREGLLDDGVTRPQFIRKQFAHAFGPGASYLIRKAILMEIQKFFTYFSYEAIHSRKEVIIDQLARIQSIPKPDVNTEDAHGALARSGWREIKTPHVICTPRTPDYPGVSRGMAGNIGDELVTLSVIVDTQGRPYRAKGLYGPSHLFPTATEWVLGWLFDMSGQRTEECQWYEFPVTVRFIIEPADMPGPIISRPGCVIGRKVR